MSELRLLFAVLLSGVVILMPTLSVASTVAPPLRSPVRPRAWTSMRTPSCCAAKLEWPALPGRPVLVPFVWIHRFELRRDMCQRAVAIGPRLEMMYFAMWL